MASYPYLPEAAAYLRDHPEEFATLPELASDVLYEGVREKAMERIHFALEREEIPIDFHSEEDCRLEVMTYILARILVAASRDGHLIRWYSLAEAVRGRKLLDRAPDTVVLQIAGYLGLGAYHSSSGQQFDMDFISYLRYSNTLKSYEWKLSNQSLAGGSVRLEREKVLRLIQEALKLKFENDLGDMSIPDELKRLFSEPLGEILGITSRLRESYERQITSVVIPTRFPPCIHNLIETTRAGENVSHSGRFAMTAFLLHIGMKIDDIVNLFKVSPDFREDLARYQVEHIGGEISGTDYESMACKTMITYGLCIGKDTLCERISHPLSYYEARNDDSFPDEERRLRRALTATLEVAKALKLPMKSIQASLLRWFKDVAILGPGNPALSQMELKENAAGDRDENGTEDQDGYISEGHDAKGIGDQDEKKAEDRDEKHGDRNGNIIEDSEKKQQGSKEEKASLEEPEKDVVQARLKKPVFHFDTISDPEPAVFKVTVSRAWMRGSKVTHPGTMEDTYIIGTAGMLEDRSGRVMRLLPVLDFDQGRILRDLQRIGKPLDILGQMLQVKGWKFMHIISVDLP